MTVCTSLFFSCGSAARLSASLHYPPFLVLILPLNVGSSGAGQDQISRRELVAAIALKLHLGLSPCGRERPWNGGRRWARKKRVHRGSLPATMQPRPTLRFAVVFVVSPSRSNSWRSRCGTAAERERNVLRKLAFRWSLLKQRLHAPIMASTVE